MDTGKKPERKPGETAKPPRSKKKRFAYHSCYHHDVWQGLLGMPSDQVGVYWRIILLMYIRRAAISDSDIEMAQLCHEPLKNYRRIKKALIERGRIICDPEHGILYDERAISELVDTGFFSEAQTARAMKRWNPKTPPRVIVDNAARSEPLAPGSNVVPLDAEKQNIFAEVSAKYGLISASSTCPSSFSLLENQTLPGCGEACQPLSTTQYSQQSEQPQPDQPPRAAQPLKAAARGSDRTDAKARRALAVKALEEFEAAKRNSKAPASDRTARRTK